MKLSFEMKEYIADTEDFESVRLRGDFKISFVFAEETVESKFSLDMILR